MKLMRSDSSRADYGSGKLEKNSYTPHPGALKRKRNIWKLRFLWLVEVIERMFEAACEPALLQYIEDTASLNTSHEIQGFLWD